MNQGQDKPASRYRYVWLLLLPWVLLTTNSPRAADLALVIDDVGYSKSRGMRAIKLPGEVTIAVLPFAPHTQFLVQQAVRHSRIVIVHQPMEPHLSPHAREESGTLTVDMAHSEFDSTFAAALDAVPSGVGVSNHTGSLLTAHPDSMHRLMQQLRHRGLFFLDSRTTAHTVALQVAREQGVPAIKRDVFLDHEPTTEAMHQAFEHTLQLARDRGQAVLIGHPYPETLEYLERRLMDLPSDIRLVNAADLVRGQFDLNHPAVLAQPPHPAPLHISPGR